MPSDISIIEAVGYLLRCEWKTLPELSERVRYMRQVPALETSISAAIRRLRARGYLVSMRPRRRGLYEYHIEYSHGNCAMLDCFRAAGPTGLCEVHYRVKP